MKKHNTVNEVVDFVLDIAYEMSQDYMTCPECGYDDVATDNNGEYEFYFCTQMDPECGWESEKGEYPELWTDEEE